MYVAFICQSQFTAKLDFAHGIKDERSIIIVIHYHFKDNRAMIYRAPHPVNFV